MTLTMKNILTPKLIMAFKKIYTAKELIESAPADIPMLLEGLFPKVGLVAVAGSSDTGKSSFLRQLAATICMGNDSFLGVKLNSHYKTVLYLSTEDDSSALRVLLKKAFQKDAPILDKLYVVDEYNLRSLHQDLSVLLKKHPCDAVIIDSTSDIIQGDMNSQMIVRQALSQFDKLAKHHKTLFIFLHHLNKNAKGFADKNHLNGSQAFEAKMRGVLVLSKTKGYTNNERTLSMVKGNYSSSEVKQQAILLEFCESTLTFIRKGYTVNVPKGTIASNDKLKEIACQYKSQGLTVRQIAAKMNADGYEIGKTKVAQLLNSGQLF